jgi:hypothetical protein
MLGENDDVRVVAEALDVDLAEAIVVDMHGWMPLGHNEAEATG